MTNVVRLTCELCEEPARPLTNGLCTWCFDEYAHEGPDPDDLYDAHRDESLD
jgi:hypothetical protein